MTGFYYILLECVKFSITFLLRHTPKSWTHGKIKAKDYVILVEFAKLLLVFLTVFVVPYVAPQLTGDQPEQATVTEVQNEF